MPVAGEIFPAVLTYMAATLLDCHNHPRQPFLPQKPPAFAEVCKDKNLARSEILFI